ncbi:PREDICTED: serine protease inhibitor Kazal-type 6 [Lipotes vexillifer]|uniref:Serine protease inhibitor Kazal-type 6 n=1 Tax=Lipotes vexillifer TaxID=118797 RepID=A0A340WKE0_LIPVE|nr:PREDICTED: serine protease inhibitor Kazal-type 6 [Lipotes vexillifer]
MAAVFSGLGVFFNFLVKKIEAQILSTLSKITQLANGKWQNKLCTMIPELTSGIMKGHCNLQIDCGEFQDPKVHCTRESNPHCGSDGRTYGNKCTFCKAMLKSGGKLNLKHHGKC